MPSYLLQQLLVLSTSTPNTSNLTQLQSLRKKRKRADYAAHNHLSIDAETIADVNAFLHRWLFSSSSPLSSSTGSSFASHLLDALPPIALSPEEQREANSSSTPRARRRSDQSNASDEQGSPIAEAVNELVKGSEKVWNMLATVAGAHQHSEQTAKWNMPDNEASSSASAASSSISGLLTELVWERDEALTLTDDQFDVWRDLLDPMDTYGGGGNGDTEAICRLLSVLVRAWKKQRQQVVAASASASSKPSAATLYDQLHLLRQISPRPSARRGYEDLGTPLDVVFSGLTNLDHWRPWIDSSSSPSSYSPISLVQRQQRAQTASLLLVELCHLATSLNAVSSDALARGIFERLSFIGVMEVQVMNSAFEEDQRERGASTPSMMSSPRQILCDAYMRHLDLEAAKKTKQRLNEETLRTVYDEDDALCMREVAGGILMERKAMEMRRSHASRNDDEDEEDEGEDEASLRHRLTGCLSRATTSASVSPTKPTKKGSTPRPRLSEGSSSDGSESNAQNRLTCALALASKALASLRRWEILSFLDLSARSQGVTGTGQVLGLQPARLAAAFEVTVQEVARDAIELLIEQRRDRSRSGSFATSSRASSVQHSRRGSTSSSISSASTAGVSTTTAKGRNRRREIRRSTSVTADRVSQTASVSPTRPRSGRVSKPPPRMGISRRSRGLPSSSSSIKDKAPPKPAEKTMGKSKHVKRASSSSSALSANDDEEDETMMQDLDREDRKTFKQAEDETWLLRALVRSTVQSLETLRGRIYAAQLGGGGSRSGSVGASG